MFVFLTHFVNWLNSLDNFFSKMVGNEKEDNKLLLGDSAWNRPSGEFDLVNGNLDDNQQNHSNQGKLT